MSRNISWIVITISICLKYPSSTSTVLFKEFWLNGSYAVAALISRGLLLSRFWLKLRIKCLKLAKLANPFTQFGGRKRKELTLPRDHFPITWAPPNLQTYFRAAPPKPEVASYVNWQQAANTCRRSKSAPTTTQIDANVRSSRTPHAHTKGLDSSASQHFRTNIHEIFIHVTLK